MTTYNFNFLWISVKNANGIPMLVLYGTCAIFLVYLTACLTLYAFNQLTGLLQFSWINGLYTMILMGKAKIVFSGK